MSINSWRLFLLALFWLPCLNLHSQSRAQSGLLNASNFDFGSKRLPLEGNWLWIDGQLISPGDSVSLIDTTVEFPKIWNDVRAAASGQGVATYALTVLIPISPDNYSIELPQIYSSYNLWVNERLVATNGTPGLTPQTTQPQWMPQTVSFNAQDTLKLILQIANFHHHKGGCKEPIYLGKQDTMLTKRGISKTSKIVECVTLLLIAIAFLMFYFLRGRKRVVIYFALLCATWSIRSAFSNEYVLISFLPNFDWASMVRIEYITLYLTMIWAILFLSRLFTNESNHIIKYILVILNCIFVAFTVLNPPLFFTKLLAMYLVTSGILLFYGVIIIIQAYINERTGSSFLTICSFLGVVLFSYDIFTYEGIFSFNSILFSVGYVVIFMMMGTALLLQQNIIKSPRKTSSTL